MAGDLKAAAAHLHLVMSGPANVHLRAQALAGLALHDFASSGVDEDLEILRRVQQLGTKWAQISAHYLPDRTENDVKNRWNSVVKKMDPPAF